MSDEQMECPECESGAPAWVMTFADLMSLLMCFFVLLLSFSEMEATKFKQMAGSLRMAFGVQKQIEAVDIPKGTSIIAQEFSPGKPQPTPVDDVRQITTEEKPELDIIGKAEEQEQREKEVEAKAEEISDALNDAINKDLIEIETQEDVIVIRIKEKGSFPSGSDELNEDFIPILAEIRRLLSTTTGKIVVVGHSDDIPIRTFRFRSNWELSAARAVSVLHELLKGEGLKAERVEVKGMAEMSPLVANDSSENRAINRRVEIVVMTGQMSGDKGQISIIDAN